MCTSANDTQPWCSPTMMYAGQRLYCTQTGRIHSYSIPERFLGVFSVPIPVPSCSWTNINASACAETVPTSSNPDEYLSTACSVESIISLSPTVGFEGTILTITGEERIFVLGDHRVLLIVGPRFSGSLCEYDIQIGSSYHCPMMNITSTELSCQIGGRSMLDPRIIHFVRVARHQRGFLASQNQLQLQFLPSISQISPTTGQHLLRISFD